MADLDEDDDGGDAAPDITCIAAHPDAKDALVVLVVTTDWEDYYSEIFRIRDFDADEDDLLHETDGWLRDLWLSPAGRLYAVDADGNAHWNRNGPWEAIPLGTDKALNRIWGFDDDLVYACGNGGFIARAVAGRWERFDDGVDGDLYGLHGTAPDDLYAVGEEGRIFHYDGARWTRLEAPTNHMLNAVFCRTATEVFVCGERGMLFVGAGPRWRRIGALDLDLFALIDVKGTLYVGAGAEGLYAYDGAALDLVREDVAAFGLGGSRRFLSFAGNDEAGRYDGADWDIRGYS